MRYSESLQYLNSFLNLEKIIYHPHNWRWNLKRMRFLLKIFADPQKSFFPVLIAGTKGKGSTGFFLQSILNACGVRSGFYSSPHLEDPRERIRILGKTVSTVRWANALNQIRKGLKSQIIPPDMGDFTYFEIMTLLAVLLFREAGVEVGVFEAGLGGRLDATNVLNARLTILTPIELDHEQILGRTIAKIATEKAAVIRHRGHVVVASQRHKDALKVIRRQCRKRKALSFFCGSAAGFDLGLNGDFQRINAGAALKASGLLREHFGFRLSEDGMRKGLQASDWPGRFEFFKGRPDILLDAAHNPASITALVRNLEKMYPKRRRVLIFASSRDKRSDQMLNILGSYFTEVILTRIPNTRSQEIGVLLAQARGHFRTVYPVATAGEALALAKQLADSDTLVVVTGSFYLLGEIRKMIRKKGR
jgi:dihydrofolate synthase/folylpolyglutamate synthase